MTDSFSTTTTINSPPSEVWNMLTNTASMLQWLGDPEMEIEVDTNWKVGSPLIIRGFHHVKFENKGVVLTFDKEKKLSYTHLSSLSRLPDKPENYSIFEFVLTPIGEQTQLTINISVFPTHEIRKHLEFYWRGTILKIKEELEQSRHHLQ